MISPVSQLEKTFLLWVLSRTTDPQLLDHILARLKPDYTQDTRSDDLFSPGLGQKVLSLVLQSERELV